MAGKFADFCQSSRQSCRPMSGKVSGSLGDKMKIILNIVAALLIVTGIVWILQGINILPGSFMTGNTHWTLAGLLLYLTTRILR
jgi:uncharacterized membrane protein YozB (DUF420 family)